MLLLFRISSLSSPGFSASDSLLFSDIAFRTIIGSSGQFPLTLTVIDVTREFSVIFDIIA